MTEGKPYALNDRYALELIRTLARTSRRQDSVVAFDIVEGRLELCGRTWEIPIRLHWSEDPFHDPQWRWMYQTLSWLEPLRRCALTGNLEARQGWWWLAATWLNSLDRLIPGEGTPWRADVAAVRACELVAGLSIVGRQPWLIAAITTHLTYLEAVKKESPSSEALPLALSALHVCHRVVGNTKRSEEFFTALTEWWTARFSPAGALYPDAPETPSSIVYLLDLVESCLALVSVPSPWAGHDQRLTQCLEKVHVRGLRDRDEATQVGSDQRSHPFVLETDRAAYSSVSGTSEGGGFVGFEESRGGPTVYVSFAHGGRVWLRGAVPFKTGIQEFPRTYKVQAMDTGAEIDLDVGDRHNPCRGHRLVHSLSSAVCIWEGQADESFDLASWFARVTIASDLAVAVSRDSIRLTSDHQTFFLVRLPVSGSPDKLISTKNWNPSFRLYVGPWHGRLFDLFHQSGSAAARLTADGLSLLAGPPELDEDLLEVYEGKGWRIASNRSVLRAEQSRIPGAGRLILKSSDGSAAVSGRGSRSKRGYLDIRNVPNGQYELQWVPDDGSLRVGPKLTFVDDEVAPFHKTMPPHIN